MKMINKSKQKHIRKIWKIIFAISLALNISIIGAIRGLTFKHKTNVFKDISNLRDQQIGSFYIRALNQNQKHELRRTLRKLINDNETRRAIIEASRQETINTLRRTEFEEDTFRVIVKAHADKSFQLLELAQENLIYLINSMSLEERLNYADRIAKYNKR